MSTNDQARKFSYVRSLRFTPVRLLLTAVLLPGLIGLIGCDTVECMGPEADSFTESVQPPQKGVIIIPSPRLGDIENKTSRIAGFETEAAVPPDSSTIQALGTCYEWEYINGEWTLVIIECPE